MTDSRAGAANPPALEVIMGNRKHSMAMDKVVKEAGRCELCGSRRGLEAHHIIPVVCGGDDSYDNLICVCQCCHARLTPRSILTKFGIKKVQVNNKRIIEEKTLKNAFKIALYEKIELYTEQYGPGIATLFDAIEDL